MESLSLHQSIPIFTQSEVEEMENLFREVKDECLTQEFCEDLATSFSSSTARTGQAAVKWEQVQNWFEEKKNEPSVKTSSAPSGSGGFVSPSKALESRKSESSIQVRASRASEINGLVYEAKSSKDNAWYDVASMLNYRVLGTGELEARVRFVGFSNAHDEWVNVKDAIRDRSIPLEPSECHRVKVGDLVLCFKERSDSAVYVDAHVVEIQRRLHDIKGCRCIFVLRYVDEGDEEKLQLDKICVRP